MGFSLNNIYNMAKTRFRRKSYGKKRKTARRQKRHTKKMRGGDTYNAVELKSAVNANPKCNFIFNTSDNGTKDVNKNNVDAVLKNLNEPFALEPKIMINQNAEKKCP